VNLPEQTRVNTVKHKYLQAILAGMLKLHVCMPSTDKQYEMKVIKFQSAVCWSIVYFYHAVQQLVLKCANILFSNYVVCERHLPLSQSKKYS